MIDHSRCEHPRTSKERAKCRRSRGEGAPAKEPTPKGASVKEVDLREKPSKTPGDPALACTSCGVERWTHRGTDFQTGTLLYMGPKCMWRIRRAPDLQEFDLEDRVWRSVEVDNPATLTSRWG